VLRKYIRESGTVGSAIRTVWPRVGYTECVSRGQVRRIKGLALTGFVFYIFEGEGSETGCVDQESGGGEVVEEGGEGGVGTADVLDILGEGLGS
jgi:hypothetical protein